jgi:RNA polymerase sigma-70 factor (ECF subfamily)
MTKNKTTPEEVIENNEQVNLIRQTILDLPPKHRAVIELRHYQEQRYQEISETLKMPLSDVKSYLFRGRRLLAKKLKENGYSKE